MDIKKMLEVLKAKRGAVGTGGLKTGVVAVLVIVLLASLAPVAFTSIYGFNATTTPTWFTTVMQVLVAITLIFIVIKQVE